MRPLARRLVALAPLLLVASTALAEDEAAARGPSEITLETSLSFAAPGGDSVEVPAGRYLVVAADGTLALTPLDGEAAAAPAALRVAAAELAHEEELVEPSAFLTASESGDAQHLVVLLPDGTGFEATGSTGEVVTRGAARISASQVRLGAQRVQVQQEERAQAMQAQVVKAQPMAIAQSLAIARLRLDAHDAPMRAVEPSALHFQPMPILVNVPKVEIALEPTEGGALVYHPIAGWTSQSARMGQLSALVYVRNKESQAITLNKATFKYGGITRNFAVDTPIAIASNQQKAWQNSRPYHELGQVIYFGGDVPSEVRIELSFDGFAIPAAITVPLKPYTRSFDLPFRAEDLREDEHWESASTHGGGSQVFAYDMGVEIPGTGPLLPDGSWDKNSSYRIYGKPIYAMADGAVKGFNDDVPNNPRPCQSEATCVEGKDKANFSSYTGGGAGNHFYIQHGDLIALYAHMQKGSLNDALKQVGAKVKKGDLLGKAGNSGNSSGPHLHVHVRKETSVETGPFRPLLFDRGFAIGKDHSPSPDSNIQWASLSRLAIPGLAGKRAYVHPDKHPFCGYPTSWGEVGSHGIADADFQAAFDSIASCGYSLRWVDGYDVGGKTYFNVIFGRSNAPWVARHNMDGASYQAEFDKWGKAGFRLVNVDSYVRGGGVRYAAVWEKSSGPPATAYHGRTRASHQSTFEDLAKQGFVPVNVSVADGRVTALYEKRNVGGFYLKSAMTLQEYKDLFKEYGDQGFELVYLNGYREGGSPRLAGIWYKQAPFSSYWAKHHLSPSDYQQQYTAYLGQGYGTRVVTGYEDGGHRFEGIWVK